MIVDVTGSSGVSSSVVEDGEGVGEGVSDEGSDEGSSEDGLTDVEGELDGDAVSVDSTIGSVSVERAVMLTSGVALDVGSTNDGSSEINSSSLALGLAVGLALALGLALGFALGLALGVTDAEGDGELEGLISVSIDSTHSGGMPSGVEEVLSAA